MISEKESYSSIFKSTFLFSFVKVFQIIVGIVRNKVIAVLLGAEGVGIIGILSNTVSLLQTGAGLGISQSAVRDVSEANELNDNVRFSRIISLLNIVILFTCLLGGVLTIVFSSSLSEWTFGDNSYTIAYIWMALAVMLNVLTEGQLAILKGMRQLRSLAKASLIGAVVGLLTAVPLYYFLGESGIVPSLIIAAISDVFFSIYFVRKIKYKKIKLSFYEIYKDASPMVKMGVALMFVSFIGLLFDLIIASYIRLHGGMEVVGYYRAGTTIISSYFGIVLTAMATDYYPRISAVHQDNAKLQKEMNKQSEVGLVLILPIAVLFVFFSPFFLQLLYTKEFIAVISYTDYAILGTIIIVVSNCMGMILLAKQASNIFIYSALIQKVVLTIVYILAYKYVGLFGLGLSYVVTGVIHISLMSIIIGYTYKIRLDLKVFKLLALVLFLTFGAVFARGINDFVIRFLLGSIMLIFSVVFSYIYMKNEMNIDVLMFFKTKK